jgi:flagellar biosynthetic protein FliR
VITFSFTSLELLVASVLWPFVRVLALITAAPVLGNRSVPVRVRVGLALAIAVVIAPGLPPPPPGALSSASAIMVLAQQMLVGYVVGFTVRLAFAAVELAGDLIGLQMGFSFAGFIDPQHSGQTPLLGSFLGVLATLMFLSLDGHLALIASITDSFRTVPVGTEFMSLLRWEKLVAMGAGLFASGLHIALPMVATLMAVNLALGVIARSAPQLNLFSVGFPMTLMLGLILLALLLPSLAIPLRAALEASLSQFP